MICFALLLAHDSKSYVRVSEVVEDKMLLEFKSAVSAWLQLAPVEAAPLRCVEAGQDLQT